MRIYKLQTMDDIQDMILYMISDVQVHTHTHTQTHTRIEQVCMTSRLTASSGSIIVKLDLIP